MTKKKEIELIIQLPEKLSTNKIYSSHWSGKKPFKDSVKLLLTQELKKQKLLGKVIDGRVIIDFQFYFVSRILDSTNCGGMGKMIEDSLVQIGLLHDDTPKYVKTTMFTSNKVVDKSVNKSDYVVIKILDTD